MKILLLANYIPDGQQSMQRFANLLETGLQQAGHEVRVIRPQPYVGQLKSAATGVGKWLGYIDKFLLFPVQLRWAIEWADVVHICDHSNAFYTQCLQDKPHVVTCNDMLAIRSALGEIPQNQTGWTGQQLQRLILKGLNQAQRVACISDQTRTDLLRLSTLNANAVSRIYMGLNYPYAPMTIAIAKNRAVQLGVPQGSRFMLHVGGNHWYKNKVGVLTLFRMLRSRLDQPNDLYLVMAGQALSDDLRQQLQADGLEAWVVEVPDATNEDLRALYSAATALLFPSLQEGFGWPIIEAQACGCPVFTSNRAPMTEVGGSAALYIDPENLAEAAEQIADQMPTLRDRMLDGLTNAQRFTPEAMVADYVKEYEQAMRERLQLRDRTMVGVEH